MTCPVGGLESFDWRRVSFNLGMLFYRDGNRSGLIGPNPIYVLPKIKTGRFGSGFLVMVWVGILWCNLPQPRMYIIYIYLGKYFYESNSLTTTRIMGYNKLFKVDHDGLI